MNAFGLNLNNLHKLFSLTVLQINYNLIYFNCQFIFFNFLLVYQRIFVLYHISDKHLDGENFVTGEPVEIEVWDT